MADVKVRIIAVDEASGPISKAGDEVEKTGKKAKEAGASFAGMDKAMLNMAGALGLTNVLSMVAGGFKNAVVASFELAAQLETTTVGFKTMLGSGEAAQGMLDELRTFASKTPFQFTELTKSASRMIAMGTAAKDVIPTLTAVGDAAAGLGLGSAGVDRITLALGQMGAKGKIGGDDLRQLSEAGVPALRYLAEAAGVTTAEMSKMIENGVIPAEQGVRVLVQSMQSDFGGLMAEQAKTATGALSNMADASEALGTEIGKRMIPAVQSASEVFAAHLLVLADVFRASREETENIKILGDAVKFGTITQKEFDDVTQNAMQTVSEYSGEIDNSSAKISDLDGVLRLLKVVENEELDLQNESEGARHRNREAVEKLVPVVNTLKQEQLQLNEAIKEQTFLMGLVGGATKEQEQDQKKNTDTITKTEEAIAKLTRNYRNNQAAILAGHGTVVDNTLAIEKANIAAERGAIQFGKLNERFANQDGIDAFNQGMGDIDEALRDLNTENAKGEMSAEKFAKATENLSDKQTALRDRFDKSKMSQQDFDLSVREHNVNLTEATTRMTNLTTEHGKGYTAAELAAQGTGTYNTKLGLLQIELEKAKQRDIELQTQVATRIKEGILLEEIALAAKNGFTDAEILMLDTAAEALGIADSEAVTGAINTGIAATNLAKLRKTYADDFVTENEAGMKAFGAAVDSIGADITNKLRPSMEDAEDAAKNALLQLKLFSDTYNGLNSKEITLTYREVRIKGEVILQNAAMAAAGVAVSEPGMAAVVNVPTGGGGGTSGTNSLAGAMAVGGPVMGGAGAYLVGERGPELFNPSGTGGTITPNNALGRSGLAIGTLNVYGVQSTSELFNQLSREARARGLQFAVN